MWYFSKMSDFMAAQHHFCPQACRSVVLNSLMTQRRLKAYGFRTLSETYKRQKENKKAEILWQRLSTPAVRNADKSSIHNSCLRASLGTWSKPHPNPLEHTHRLASSFWPCPNTTGNFLLSLEVYKELLHFSKAQIKARVSWGLDTKPPSQWRLTHGFLEDMWRIWRQQVVFF